MAIIINIDLTLAKRKTSVTKARAEKSASTTMIAFREKRIFDWRFTGYQTGGSLAC
jgi:hypothetical protein